MPQLNPSPWLLILLFTWLVFLTIIPPKILGHTFPNDPASQNTEKPKTESWVWPWY
uniref:ATP synthase complex subunit 8 n=1 Tax=Minimugil cascasia TaxID=1040955 RepID=I1T2F3_MINCA|nr:ATP synthase F0 subunit 8 [Minimugil cascasia]AEK53175.1 ATP synthase F0 subunit 8 [Minimugil cascasia]